MVIRKNPGTLLPRIGEAVLLCLLCFLATVLGFSHLKDWKGPAGSLTNDLYIPAIMMNAGHGFSNISADGIPELRDFLDFKREDFSLAQIPDDITLQPLHPYQEFHRYLLYTVAASWYCFGVNWHAIKVLLVFLLLLSVLLIYALSRLVLRPLLSFAVALGFSASAALYWALPLLRDFAKTPFILALLLILGGMIRCRLPRRRYVMLAFAAGIIMGIGLGFRRDLMVFLPLVLAMVAVVRFDPPALALRRRGAAWLLTLVGFVLAGLPIHLSLYREGFLAAHDTLMGFASYSDKELGNMAPASYEKHYLLNDLFSTFKAYEAAKRGVTFPQGVYEERLGDVHFDLEVKSAYVRKLAETFPADVLTRACASVVRIHTGILVAPYAFLRFFERFGLWFLFLSFIILAALKPREAFLLLILLSFSCGITSLQFGVRHSVQLAFLPYFFAALLLEFLLRGLGQCLHCFRKKERPFSKKSLLAASGRAAFWFLIVIPAFILPLKAARWFQYRQVSALVKQYEEQQSDALHYITREWDDRIVFMPLIHERPEGEVAPHLMDNLSSRLFEVRLSQMDEAPDLQLVYEAEKDYWDFGSLLSCGLVPGVDSGPVRCFFPVHESNNPGERSHFIGVSLPQNQRHCFGGFQEIVDFHTCELLMPLFVPDRPRAFLHWQQLELPWAGAPWKNYPPEPEFQPFIAKMEIKNAIMSGNMQAAIDLAGKALCHRPDSPEFTLLLMEALEGAGREGEAREQALALLETFHASPGIAAQVNQFYECRGGESRARTAWKYFAENLSYLPWKNRLSLYLDEETR